MCCWRAARAGAPGGKAGPEPPVDVRFIEVMPIGAGAESRGLAPAEARKLLLAQWPDLHPVDEHRGNGPAHYDASARLLGRIGWIEAVSHAFCASCNRARVTSTGLLKPCLCYGEGTDLRALLRGGAGDAALEQAMAATIYEKPWGPTALAGVRSRSSTSWRPLAAENRKTSRILYLWESSKQFAFPKVRGVQKHATRKPT